MRLAQLKLLLRSTIFLLMLSAGNAWASDRNFVRHVVPFLKNHCLRCHGPEEEEGGVRVDQLKWDLDDLGNVDELQNVLDEIVVNSMPPAGEPRPTDAELKQISDLLRQHISDAKEKHSSGGGKPVRRLTKTEYVNTINDLLGVRVDAADIPEDGHIGDFDTQADELYTTDMHIERFLDVARDAVKRFIASRNSKPGRKTLKSLPAPRAKKGGITVKATSVPPAGFQVVRLVCLMKNPNSSKRIYFGPARNETYEITGTRQSPQNIDLTFYKPTAEKWVTNPNVVVKEIQNIQVINPQPYSFFAKVRKRYGDRVPDSEAGKLIADFVALVNRGRQVDRKLVTELLDIFQLGRRQGQTFWEAMVEPMALSMCTIEAMFHFENRSAVEESRYVSPIEMVNRVSYFLWRSAPDAELIRLAQTQKWYESAVRRQQFQRMVKDEKFERFLRDFATQWLELDRQDEIAVDNRLFRNFNNNAKASIKEETIQFVSHIIRENLPLRNLIHSDFMLANNLTAQHYGLPKLSGSEFRVVRVPEGSKRGGILTHAGILMQAGTGDRTSITERGAFVARKLLNDPPGDPPPLVDELPSRGKAVEKMTASQLVAMHRNSPQCASCHNKIDPIRMALEELDAVGQFRTKDVRINPNLDKLNKRQRKNPKNLTIQVPLNTKGQIQGRAAVGVDGVKKALLSKDHKLAEAYIQALLSMANGRKSGVADETIVDGIVQRAQSADLPALSILVAVLRSDAFKTH